MITIPGLTNCRRGQSVQPETTAIDPGSGRPMKLTVPTQMRPEIGFPPARLERELNFANFNNEVASWCWTIVYGRLVAYGTGAGACERARTRDGTVGRSNATERSLPFHWDIVPLE